MLIFFHNIWKCIFFHRKITYRGYFYTSLKLTYLFDKHFVIFISDGSIILTFANININLCRENVSIINYANESSLHKYYNDFVLCWPEKVVPVFGLDAKFGNNSILGYQISPNYVIFLQAVLLLLREIEGNRQSLSLNYLKLDYSLKLHLKLNLVILISNIYNWKWHYKIYLIPFHPVHSVLPWWDLYTKQKSSK